MTSTRALWAVVLAAAALRLFPVWFGLPYPYARPDETQAIGGALRVLDGDLNPHFFHWPSLTFYLFATVLGPVSKVRTLLGMQPALTFEVAVLAARIVVALAGALTVIPAFQIGRRIGGRAAGLAAAAFLAVAPLHVRDSHFAMTDVLMTLLLTMCLARLFTAYDTSARGIEGESHALRQYALAGLLGGLAASTKYNAAAVIAAMAAVQLLLVASHRWSMRWRSLLPSIVFVAALAAGFVAATPFSVLDFPAFAADFSYDLAHLSEGHAVPVGRGWYAHLGGSLPYGCGFVVLAAAAAGLWIGARRHHRHTFVLASFAAAYFAIIGGGYTAFFRYAMPLVPVVCVFAALAAARTSELVAKTAGVTPALAAAVVALAIGGPSAITSVRMDLLLSRTDTRVIAARWLGPRLRPEQTLHDAGSDYARLDLRDRAYHEWRFDPAARSFGHPTGATPDWIVIADSPLRHYASADPVLQRLASERYDPVFTVKGPARLDSNGVYDQQDAFFVPFSGFDEVERPGPTITIYRRRD